MKKMIDMFSEDIEKTQRRKFISALRKTAKRFREECEKYSIIHSIAIAENFLQ